MKLNSYLNKIQEDQEYIETKDELSLHFELANAILKARLEKGWSQKELAIAVGTKQANISRIEAGLANPTLSLIHRLVKVLELELSIKPVTINYSAKFSSENDSVSSIRVDNWPAPGHVEYQTDSTASKATEGHFHD